MSQMRRYMFVRVFTTDDSGSQDGVGWRQTSRDSEGGKEAEIRDQSVDKRSRDKPALQEEVRTILGRDKTRQSRAYPGHDRSQEHC